jgi:hypothetical protein
MVVIAWLTRDLVNAYIVRLFLRATAMERDPPVPCYRAIANAHVVDRAIPPRANAIVYRVRLCQCAIARPMTQHARCSIAVPCAVVVAVATPII